VVLYTSKHEGSLATLSARELARVVAIWTARSRRLFATPTTRAVLVFENRGDDVGATLPHPHGQIYAFDHHPRGLGVRVSTLEEHRAAAGSCLHCLVADQDAQAGPRTVEENASFTVTVPFAPSWPFEIHVRAKRHGARRLTDLDSDERRDLPSALRSVVHRYDRLFDTPMAYMMACQQAPTLADGRPQPDWHLSFEFTPPNRGPDKLKYRASVETAAGFFINDTLPETSAAQLRDVPVPSPWRRHDVPDLVVADDVPEARTG
jgi:UDPglucose--hexose-1-phosphate uridylyltransferase